MTAPRLAWGLFGLWVGLSAVAVVLSAGAGDTADAIFTPALVVFAAVGALVAARHPRNPMGWTLEAAALGLAATGVIEAYVATAEAPAQLLLWLDDWVYTLWLVLGCVWVPLLFPDGRLPSRAWRWVAWAGTATFAVTCLGRAFGDRRLDTTAPADPQNPYALPGALGDVAAQAATVAETLLFISLLGVVAAVVARFRGSRGEERQQLKWFAYVGTLMLAALLLAALSFLDPERLADNIGTVGWGAFLALFILGLPLAIGIAMLRHRLYDIDVVINRTLVYGALTATLGATYLSLVLLIGLTLGTSNLAIAVSTLAVAALFRPARARIQAAVDRRFYRRRYDAARTLEAFGGRLRDELDLDALQRELRGVVADTVQPAHVSLWLRSER